MHHLPDTDIATLLRTSATNDQAVVPICDEAGRLKGYCISNALLAGLDQSLAALAAKAEEAVGDAAPAQTPEEPIDG